MAATKSVTSPLLVNLCQSRPLIRDLMLATLLGALTALGAQARLALPGTPVPVTGQVFCVLLAGGLLGPRLGALSQAEYLLMGAAGLPVFAGGTGGLLSFLGPSAGYLWGFILGAFIMGLITASVRGQTSPWSVIRIFLGCLAAILAIYLPGVLWLAGWHAVTASASLGISPSLLRMAIIQGALPFIPWDLAKAAVAVVMLAGLYRACPTDEH